MDIAMHNSITTYLVRPRSLFRRLEQQGHSLPFLGTSAKPNPCRRIIRFKAQTKSTLMPELEP